MITDESGKVYDCSEKAKDLLGISEMSSANCINSFAVQDIHPSFSPAELYKEVHETSIYHEQEIEMKQVQERLCTVSDPFDQRGLKKRSSMEYNVQIRVIRERFSIGLNCYTYILFIEPKVRSMLRKLAT